MDSTYDMNDNTLSGVVDACIFLFSTDGVIGRAIFAILYLIEASVLGWIIWQIAHVKIDSMSVGLLLTIIACPFIILSMVSLSIRRMRDIGKSPWYIGIPLYNLYLLLFIKGKSRTMKLYRDFLKKQRIEFEENENGIYMNFQGLNWLIENNDGDEQFFRIIIVFGIERITPEIKEILHNANARFKCFKTHYNADTIAISCESFLDRKPVLEDIFFRVTDLLQSARIEIFEAIKNSENSTSKFD